MIGMAAPQNPAVIQNTTPGLYVCPWTVASGWYTSLNKTVEPRDTITCRDATIEKTAPV